MPCLLHPQPCMMSSSITLRSDRRKLVCIKDYHDVAKQVFPGNIWKWHIGAADEGQTMADCQEAFKRYRLRPRLLRNVSTRQLSTTILGHPVDFPICISPTAGQGFANIEGDKATARAAQSLNTIMVVSASSFVSFKDIALAAPDCVLWFQIHLFKDRRVTEYFVRQAERAGFTAVVVTVDSPVRGNQHSWKRGDIVAREEFRVMNINDQDNPDVRKAIASGDIGLWQFIIEQLTSAETWASFKWLKSITKLLIVAKGVLTGESAREAMDAGVDAILVSAHGGRQLDGVPATIDALPEVVKAVQGSGLEVYMDGGIRLGTDVFKALALGARAVFLGRPILWGLAVGGENGVKNVVELLRDELSLTMALTGNQGENGVKNVVELVRDELSVTMALTGNQGENGVKNVVELLRDELSLTMALTGCSKLEDIEASMVVHESKYLSKSKL